MVVMMMPAAVEVVVPVVAMGPAFVVMPVVIGMPAMIAMATPMLASLRRSRESKTAQKRDCNDDFLHYFHFIFTSSRHLLNGYSITFLPERSERLCNSQRPTEDHDRLPSSLFSRNRF
jgi:hypothetical protein